MQIQIPAFIIHKSTCDNLKIQRSLRKVEEGDRDTLTSLHVDRLSVEDIAELVDLAKTHKAGKYERALTAILKARRGTSDYKVPSFTAFLPVLKAYLEANFVDGWIYEMGDDGILRPWAITRLEFLSGSNHHSRELPSVKMTGHAFGPKSKDLAGISKVWTFEASDVSRRHVAKILENAGLFVETHDLKAEWRTSDAVFSEVIRDGFAKQFRITGAYRVEGFGRRDSMDAVGHRGVMDIDPSRIKNYTGEIETSAYETESDARFIDLPRHDDVLVYDLTSHESHWISCKNIEKYVYRPELKDLLILPEAHGDLLDVLTTNPEFLTEDIIEGKAAGNIILCKGVPGIGKTLTAEIYSEICGKPLYSVHAGILGTTAEKIAVNLREVLQRAQRWDCILLIDEADVFVSERGDNVEKNAIVAEFLRTLEFFKGLMFMTTNRPNDIDHAIISRCAAIIHYELPGADDRKRIWKVMSDNFNADLSDSMIDSLVDIFKDIAARDVKMLLRLVIRVALSKDQDITLDMFRQGAMFRAIKFEYKQDPSEA